MKIRSRRVVGNFIDAIACRNNVWIENIGIQDASYTSFILRNELELPLILSSSSVTQDSPGKVQSVLPLLVS